MGWGTLRSTVERMIWPMEDWFAVMTKPRSEAIAEAHLSRQGFRCLYPRVSRVLRTADSLISRIEPLFPRYMFIQADPEQHSLASVRSTRGVCGLVRFGAEPVRVPVGVIDGILSRIDEDCGLVRLKVPMLERGREVRVTGGALSGLHGVFQERVGSHRVRLLLSMLGTVREIVLPQSQLAACL
jgi:transcriptional antiterminator RfaH